MGLFKSIGSVLGSIGGGVAEGAGVQSIPVDQYNIDMSAFDPNSKQRQLNSLMLSQVLGNGPSIAQSQAQMQQDQLNSQAAGLIGSAGVNNPALAMRQLANQQAQMQQQSILANAMLRAKEQQEAMSLYSGALNEQQQNKMQGQALQVENTGNLNAARTGAIGSMNNTRMGIFSGLGQAAASSMNRGK